MNRLYGKCKPTMRMVVEGETFSVSVFHVVPLPNRHNGKDLRLTRSVVVEVGEVMVEWWDEGRTCFG